MPGATAQCRRFLSAPQDQLQDLSAIASRATTDVSLVSASTLLATLPQDGLVVTLKRFSEAAVLNPVKKFAGDMKSLCSKPLAGRIILSYAASASNPASLE